MNIVEALHVMEQAGAVTILRDSDPTREITMEYGWINFLDYVTDFSIADLIAEDWKILD
jgi:hypothetical protein